MYPIIALPHCPATARHILPLEDTRQAAHLQRRNIMPEPATAPVVPPTVFRKGLLLHCGAEVIDRRTLSRVETPSCTESWFPIPHDFLLKEVESQLTAHGFGIGETTHALSHEGKRYFGVLQILRPDDGPKRQRLTDKAAHDLLIRAVDCRAIMPTVLPEVIRYWREPLHEEFRPRTVWSLFNAFTEQFKAVNPHVAAKRSQALHGLCDSVCGLIA